MTDRAGPRAVLVTTAVADEAVAGAIARTVVEESLAACVQVSPPVASTYRWRGTIETAREWVVQCKTMEASAEALMARIKSLHPYDVPEILVTPVLTGDADYLAWLASSTGPTADTSHPT